jgi:hypothetical protein
MHGPAAARVAPRTVGRVGTPYFGRITSAPRFGPAYRGLGHGYLRRRGFVLPIWWDGVLYYVDATEPYDYSYYSEEAQPTYPYATQPAPIIIQLPPMATAQPSVSQSQALPPEPDLGPLILVRRDGQELKAVAFTITGDRVTYITPEGMRRSFAVAELDKESTREKNDVNGTTVVLPR